MRLPTTPLNRIKNFLHIGQAAIIVLCIILTIAVFASSGQNGAGVGWYFGLCWLSIPCLLYLTMVPAWSRARKFSNVYAFAGVDTFMAVAWLSAWAAVANYVVSGKGKGDNRDATGCANFKFGSATRCRLSEAIIVFGVFVMGLFVATALISFKAVLEFKRTGVLPHDNVEGLTSNAAAPFGAAQGSSAGQPRHDDEAFDSNMNLRDNWEVEEYGHDEYQDRYGGDARQGGTGSFAYGRVGMSNDHDDYDDRDRVRPAAIAGSSNPGYYNEDSAPSHPGRYADDHDLSNQRPTSTGPGPLGGDTSYHSPTYAQEGQHQYGR